MDCVHSLTHHSGPFHPVTGEPYRIDTGSRLVGKAGFMEEFSPPAWADQRGGIVGVADVVDCVAASNSPWFVGRYGFVLANQRPLPFIPVKGALGFFDWRKNLVAI